MRDFAPARKRKQKKHQLKKKRTNKADSQNRPFLRFFSWLVGLVIAVGLVGFSLYFFAASILPLSSEKTIVFVSNQDSSDVFIVRFSPQEYKVYVAYFESDMLVSNDLVNSWEDSVEQIHLGSVFSMLERLDSEKNLTSVYSLVLGTIIDDLVISNKNLKLDRPEVVQQYLIDALKNKDSLLSKNELLRLLFFSQDRVTSWEFLDVIAQAQDDSFSFINNTLEQQSCSITVLNATDTRGLADNIGSIITASDLKVVRITNDEKIQDVSQVYYDPATICKETAFRLSKVLPKSMISEDANKAKYYRANIVISLGKDLIVPGEDSDKK